MTNPLGMFDIVGRAADLSGDVDEEERAAENGYGCVIMVALLLGMLLVAALLPESTTVISLY